MPRLINRDEDWDDDSDRDEDADFPDFGDDEPMIPCPHCGLDIHDEAERCPHCDNTCRRKCAPARKPWWIIVGVAVCLYVVYRWNVWW